MHVLIHLVKEEIKCTFENAYVKTVKAQLAIKISSIGGLHIITNLNVHFNRLFSFKKTNLNIKKRFCP